MWVPVVYKNIKPGYYEVSDKGEIRSARTKKLMKKSVATGGYLQVNLRTTDGKSKSCQFHRVVLSSFTGGNQPDMEVDHVNCNKLDNRSSLSYKEIAKLFPKYGAKQLRQVIQKMATGKLYKPIMDEVERSTTIDDFVDQMMLEGHC